DLGAVHREQLAVHEGRARREEEAHRGEARGPVRASTAREERGVARGARAQLLGEGAHEAAHALPGCGERRGIAFRRGGAEDDDATVRRELAQNAAEGERRVVQLARVGEPRQDEDDGGHLALLRPEGAAHVELPAEELLGEGVGLGPGLLVDRGEHQDRPPQERLARREAAQDRGPGQAEALGERRGEAGVDCLDVLVAHADSRVAAAPRPPAAHTEMRARAGRPVSAFFWASIFAVEARMRPPVAAKGWPAASEEPSTLSLLRSTEPKAPSRPRRSRQKVSSSQAASAHSTVEAKASWI